MSQNPSLLATSVQKSVGSSYSSSRNLLLTQHQSGSGSGGGSSSSSSSSSGGEKIIRVDYKLANAPAVVAVAAAATAAAAVVPAPVAVNRFEVPLSALSMSKHDSLDRDELLPPQNVSRIMRKILPPNTTISKDCLEEAQRAATEFISFISSEAGIHCLQDKRKTVTGEDILFALDSLGFDQYCKITAIFLQKYRSSRQAIVLEEGKKSQSH